MPAGRRRRGALAPALTVLALLGACAACGNEDPGPPPAVRAAQPAGDELVVVAVGDIADDGDGDAATATVARRLRPELVLTTGDNAYPDGSAEDFSRFYAPTWGALRAITRPVPGNHEYETPGARGYFGYFGDAAGEPGRGYYTFRRGGWRFVALNTEVAHDAASPQLRWLERVLREPGPPCTLAYWHRPRFTSGGYDDDPGLAPLWRALQRAGADIVLSGHDHVYERYGPLDADGRADPAGIRQFVVGTGGRRLHELRPDRRRIAGTDDTLGVLELRLRRGSYDARFVPAQRGERGDAVTGVRCG